MLLTEIEKQSFCCNSDCLLSALRNLFASFCWLIPPLRPKSTKPWSSTYLSYKDSFMISITSCNQSHPKSWTASSSQWSSAKFYTNYLELATCILWLHWAWRRLLSSNIYLLHHVLFCKLDFGLNMPYTKIKICLTFFTGQQKIFKINMLLVFLLQMRETDRMN